MTNYLATIEQIKSILQSSNQPKLLHQINNGLLMGGTHGEKFSIICSLLKTYEISNPQVFHLIEGPANELLSYAKIIGYDIATNFSLVDELSK